MLDAGANLDESFHPALDRDLARPFLLLGAGARGIPGSSTGTCGTGPSRC